MLIHLSAILQFMLDALLRVWPYLLLTIPIAVAVNLGGASRYINRAFSARPVVAILLATAVGAFSPFCSCSVVPVVAALLIGGVPLAPVMAFWIASPSMDPETFFLSVTMLGWPLALWRLGATLALSLGAGYLTHLLVAQGWLGGQLLRPRAGERTAGKGAPATGGGQIAPSLAFATVQTVPLAAGAEASSRPAMRQVASSEGEAGAARCGGEGGSCSLGAFPAPASDGRRERQSEPALRPNSPTVFPGWSLRFGHSRHLRRLMDESWQATAMVARFMLLAFFLEALITLYVPQAWIVGLLGQENAFAVPLAALLGVPVYTSNLAALPLVGGLLGQGMEPAAALAFLVAGPTTTLPAMTAVWGLVRGRVFLLYVGLALVGAVLAGLAYTLLM
ncbi:MAG: permease [Candidatus Promineifilaceae bacterium]|nr:permease [Candidatus Promineifilaceae bacterium]